VAVTGVVDRKRGMLVDAPYLGWASLDIAAQLEKHLEIPVVVDRIANALLAAEASNAVEPLNNALLFNVGFGMSAAFLVDGSIAYGANLMAGHVGHLESDDQRTTCSCGRKGCLNIAASGWAALAELGEIKDEIASAEEFQRYRGKLADLLGRERQGEPMACGALRRVGGVLGRAMRRFQIALDPTAMFLSGPVGRAASFVEGARLGVGEDFAELILCCERQVGDSGALMALDEFVRSPRIDFDRLQRASLNSKRLAQR
jgi:glucokinase